MDLTGMNISLTGRFMPLSEKPDVTGTLVKVILLAILVACCTAGVVIVSELSPKFLLASMVMAVAATILCGILVSFRQHYAAISTFFLMVTCGVAVQFFAFSNGMVSYDKVQDTLGHLGGAPLELVFNLFEIPTVLLAILAVYKLAIQKETLPSWTGFDTIVLFFVSISTMSILNSANPSLGFWEIFRYGKLTVLYFSLRCLLCRYNLAKVIIAGFLFMLAVETVVGLAQYFCGFQVPFRIGGLNGVWEMEEAGTTFIRTTGLIGHCNGFAAWLICPLALALGILFTKVRALYKAIALVVFLSGVAVLLTTFSRAGWTGFAFSSATIFLCALATGRVKISTLGLLSAVAIGIGLIGSQTDLFQMVYARLFFTSNGPTQGRIDLLPVAANMIAAHPFFGVGLNSFDVIMDCFDPNGISLVLPDPVHNIYLLVAAETGFLGLLAFLSAGINLLVKNIALMRRKTNESMFAVSSALCATLVGLGANGLFDWSMRQDYILVELAILAALTVHSSTVIKQGPVMLAEDEKKREHESPLRR